MNYQSRKREVVIRLREIFGNRVVGIHFDTEWPPRSPDTTPCDFFMWGYLKSKVYGNHPPHNIDDLRQRIINEFNSLRQSREMIRRTVSSMRRRCEICIERNGRQVEN